MTQEEKARAYDEALERARKELKQDLHESGVWAIQRIFPKLAESEDERIRKKLCEFIHDTLGDELDNYDITKQEALAWLEKQKEQKPAEWNANDKAFIKDCARILDENGYAASAERLLSMFPVKPAEWSEKDEAMMNNILRVLSCFIGSVECESNTALSTSYPLYRREMDWLKSLCERLVKED